MCTMVTEKIRQNWNHQESEHQDEYILKYLFKLKLLIMLFKACLEKYCINGCVIHELRDTLTKISDDTEMTKNLGIKMSACHIINAS